MTKINYDALDAVAEALEGDWVAEGRGLDEGFSHWGTRGTLTRSDRLTLTLRTEPWVAPGTMEVSGYGHSINVGLVRDPGAIARDITRRLIPDAEEGWADSKAAEEAALTRAAGMEATASALEEAGLRRVDSPTTSTARRRTTMTDTGKTRAELLADAEAAVNGDRNADYGDPNQDFKRTAEFWSTYLGIAITPTQVGMMMALLKISRSVWSPGKRDNYLDLAGYAACTWSTVTPAEAESTEAPLADWELELMEAPAVAVVPKVGDGVGGAGEWDYGNLPVGTIAISDDHDELTRREGGWFNYLGGRIHPKRLRRITYLPSA